MATTPTSKKWLVGQIIKRMIERWMSEQEETRRNLKEVGKLIGFSQSRISELIAGKGSIGLGDLERLSRQLGFDDQAHIDFLLKWREDWNKRGAWSEGVPQAVLHKDVQLIVDMEWDALSVRCVGSEIVPGLLQNEPYVRAVFATRTNEDDAALEDVVQARLQRLRVLRRPGTPLEYGAVLSESCLKREVGGADVMRSQMDHLMELSKLPNVTVQVIPFKVLPTGGLIDRFDLLELPSSGVVGPLGLAYTESPGEIRFIDSKDALIAYNRAWSRLTAVALSPDETRKVLRYYAGVYQ
jgi:plasmid maintenance system antidote protein VapI